jgi:hypothetical protein
VVPVEAGTYRIEIGDRDEVTIVQVRDGKAQVAGARQDFNLSDGERLTLRGGERVTAEFDRLSSADEFDQWSQARNDRAQRVAAARYVSADVIGYEDLDEYGSWHRYNDYGDVWVPTHIHTGWAPYRFGHWAWVSPWGWTWIDDAPWGFAPFHYGRWAMVDRRWCWVPGPRTVRAVYAPALVAWVGTPGVNVAINIGSRPVGWIPLGPREVYRPYYRGSHAYVTRVNLSNARLNNTEFERVYRRQPHDNDYRNHGAVSVVQADTLRNARPVGGHLIRANQTQLQPLASQPVVRPERVDRTHASPPPLAPNTRQVISRRDTSKGDATNRFDGRNGSPRVIPRPVTADSPAIDARGHEADRLRDREGREGNTGRGIEHGASDRLNNRVNDTDANRGEPRDSGRTRVNNEPRVVRPTSQPDVPPAPAERHQEAPAPARVEPAPRNDRWARPQSERQEVSTPAENSQPARMERQRNVRTPGDPAPVRNIPAPASPRMPATHDEGRSRGDDRRGERGRDRDAR